jgi:hypothetical protein
MCGGGTEAKKDDSKKEWASTSTQYLYGAENKIINKY